jgi:hypothetical protein
VLDRSETAALPVLRAGQATAPTKTPPTNAATTRSPISSSKGGDDRRRCSDAGWGCAVSTIGRSPPGTQPSNITSQGLELAGADVILL